MKNRISRLCAVLIAALLAVSSIFSVSAAGLDTVISGDLIQSREAAVREAVAQYFEFKKDVLCDGITSIPEMHPILLGDEQNHREKVDNSGAEWLDSICVIENLVFWDHEYADVELVETVTYMVNGETKEENITHKVRLVGRDTEWRVIDDAYFEKFTNFRSCAYVDPAEMTETMASGDGSKLCIIEIAKDEIGNGEDSQGNTKYGYWYNPGTGDAEWCVIFVAWCANHADIPVSVIPKYSGTGQLKKFYADRGRFDYTPSRGGDADPKTGDIIFFQGSVAETGHVAIVSAVGSTTVTYIEGNNGSGKVGSVTISKSAAQIVGYGRPAYPSSSHVYPLWKSNSTHHWKQCENCGYISGKTLHTAGSTWSTDSTYHWNLCTTCSAVVNKAPHTTIQNSATGKEECLTCGYESSININTVPEETSETE